MNAQKILFTSLVVILSLFFILTSTYLDTKKNSNLDKILLNSDIGFEKLSNSGTDNIFTKIDETYNFTNSEIYLDNVNNIDNVYFSSDSYSKKINENNITFLPGIGGIYIFDLFDLTNNFNIDGNTFKITPKSPGRFFIDNRNLGNIKIISFDSIFDVTLMNNGQEMTNIIIYPKMYFGFNTSRNKFLKNADLLRIESISNISYIKEDLLVNNNINLNFLKKIYHSNDKIVVDFLKTFFNMSYSKKNIDKYNISEIVFYPNNKLSGFDYIDKYFLFFLNNEKRVIYYKKNIINNLNKLFKKDEKIDNDEVLISLKELKRLNNTEYKNFSKVLYYYYDNLLKINSIDYIDKVFLLSEIISIDKGISKTSLLKSSFFLNKIYSLVNNKIYTNDYLQANLFDFLKDYLKENEIDMNKNYAVNIKNKNNILKIDYLSFFIKNILLYNLNLSDTKNIDSILNILKIYNNINISINNLKNNEKSETLIIENSSIIDKILYEIRKNFFQKELNDIGLLVLSNDIELSSKNLEALNEVMKSLFSFYNSKKMLISEKNKIYNEAYIKNQKTYKEYYDALDNYQEYLIKYDKTSKKLLETKTILENNSDIVLSKNNLSSYLSSFEGVDYSNISFDTIDNNYYKINNININGEIFSFNLYPKEFNRIDNIIKNKEKLSLSYELDNIKYDWDKQYEDADESVKNKYDFKYFFINIFFNKNETVKETFVLDDNKSLNENMVVQIFKRDKLLGDRGDFTLLKGFLDLKYNDIKVTLNNNIYDIKLENILLTTSINLNLQNIDIIGVLSSDYVFNEKEHYFKNISIKFYDLNAYNNGEKVFLFEGKALKIYKNINIVDFKNEMNSIIAEYFTNN